MIFLRIGEMVEQSDNANAAATLAWMLTRFAVSSSTPATIG
jgi:hypothetical protein